MKAKQGVICKTNKQTKNPLKTSQSPVLLPEGSTSVHSGLIEEEPQKSKYSLI